VDQQATALAAQLAAAQSQAAADQATAAVTAGLIASGRPDGSSAALASPVMTQLRPQREIVAAQLAEAQVRYGKNHPSVRLLEAQIATIDAAIEREEQRVASGVRSAAQASARRANEVAAQLATVRRQQAVDTTVQVGAEKLARIADTKRASYIQLAQSAARSIQEEALTRC
jgi:uncharacterized protein involved in exopolysaccharide biosynthesis